MSGVYKCVDCGRRFDLTTEEVAMGMGKREAVPFCSIECYAKNAPAFVQKLTPRRRAKFEKEHRRFYHIGEVGAKPTGGRKSEIVVRPINSTDAAILHRQKMRSGFSGGAAVCILPSAHYYGKFPRGACNER